MSLEQIVKIQEDRKRREMELYDKVYDRVKDRINNYAKHQSQACFWQVPNYVYGYPLLNVPKTMEYILANLNHEGFIAFQVDGYTDWIYISWELSAVKRKEMAERKRKKGRKSRISLEEEKEKRDDELIQALVSAKLKER
jgi:hypothetical protein